MAEEAIFVGGDDTVLLKKAIARLLYSKGIDQSKISDILNISQPMVSNYCSSSDAISENIVTLAEKIADRIIEGYSINFNTCVSFSNKSLKGNFFVANKNELISIENSKIIDNLNQAFLNIKGKEIAGLIPEVKINIAMAKEGANSSEDVAAFLNGLLLVEDKVTGHNGIRFGKSKHLSALLLDLKARFNVKAIMNIAYNEDLLKTGFNVGLLSQDFKINDCKTQYDILIHKGDFGIEPCAYVLGKDAVDVSNKIIELNDKIKGE